MSKEIASVLYKEKLTLTPYRNMLEMCEIATKENKLVQCFFLIENLTLIAQPGDEPATLMEKYRTHAQTLEDVYTAQEAPVSKEFINAPEPVTLQFVALEEDSPVITKSQIEYVRHVLQRYDETGR